MSPKFDTLFPEYIVKKVRKEYSGSFITFNACITYSKEGELYKAECSFIMMTDNGLVYLEYEDLEKKNIAKKLVETISHLRRIPNISEQSYVITETTFNIKSYNFNITNLMK